MASLLGAFGGLLSGAGQGVVNVSKEAMDREAEAMKEQRIAEAAARQRQEEYQYGEMKADAQSKRSLLDHQARQQSDLEFTTNPDNVAKSTNAQLYGQKGMDAYNDSRFNKKVEQERQIHDATHPGEAGKTQAEIDKINSDTDVNKAQAENYKAQADEHKAQVEALKNKGVGDQQIQLVESLRKSIDDDMKSWADMPEDDGNELSGAKQAFKVNVDGKRQLLDTIYSLALVGKPANIPKGTPPELAKNMEEAKRLQDAQTEKQARQQLIDRYNQSKRTNDNIDPAQLSNDELMSLVVENETHKPAISVGRGGVYKHKATGYGRGFRASEN